MTLACSAGTLKEFAEAGVASHLLGAAAMDAGLAWESLGQEVLVQPGRAMPGAAASMPCSRVSPQDVGGDLCTLRGSHTPWGAGGAQTKPPPSEDPGNHLPGAAARSLLDCSSAGLTGSPAPRGLPSTTARWVALSRSATPTPQAAPGAGDHECPSQAPGTASAKVLRASVPRTMSLSQ